MFGKFFFTFFAKTGNRRTEEKTKGKGKKKEKGCGTLVKIG